MNSSKLRRFIVDLWVYQTGAGVGRNTIRFRSNNISCCRFESLQEHYVLLVLGVGMYERGDLLTCGVHVANAISAFQTKLSTVSKYVLLI